MQRTHNLPIPEDRKGKGINIVKQIASDNRYSHKMINHLADHTQKFANPHRTNKTDKKWVPFTYFDPDIRKITNIFRNTRINIPFRPTNTFKTYITDTNKTQNDLQKGGVYEITCHTCDLKYVGQIIKRPHNTLPRTLQIQKDQQSEVSLCITYLQQQT